MLTARMFGTGAAAAAALMLAATTTTAESFRLSHMFAADSLPGQSAAKLAELIAEKGGPDFTTTVIPAGALGDERANLEQLMSGSIDMALTGDLVISSMARPYMLVSMPFLYDSPEHSMAVFNGEIGDEINAYLLENHGIRALGWQYVGTRVVTSSTPVHNLAELEGLSMRLPPAEMWVKAWEKTGVAIASIAFTELYLALQTGTVRAQENPPNFIRAQRFNEVQRYLMPTDHVPQMQVFFMNAARYDALDDEARRILDEAAAEAVAWTSEQAASGHQADLDWLLSEGGMELVDFDSTGIQELLKDVPHEVGGDEGVALYERIRALAP